MWQFEYDYSNFTVKDINYYYYYIIYRNINNDYLRFLLLKIIMIIIIIIFIKRVLLDFWLKPLLWCSPCGNFPKWNLHNLSETPS